MLPESDYAMDRFGFDAAETKAYPCHLLQALDLGQALDVPPDDIAPLSFTEDGGGLKAMGARDIKGGTVVLIISPQGALMVHLSPLPCKTEDPNACVEHTRAIMKLLIEWTTHLSSLFMTHVKAVVMYAKYEGLDALPDQITTIQYELTRTGAPEIKMIPYQVTRGANTGAQGTFFVDGRFGIPRVFAEDIDLKIYI